MRCHRCKQPGHFAWECRAPARISSTCCVVRRKVEPGGEGVPALTDTGVEVSIMRQELDVDQGSSSSAVCPSILPDGPAAPKPAVLPSEQTSRTANEVPLVASESRRRTPQLPVSLQLILPGIDGHVPPQPAVPCQSQTLQIVGEVSPVVTRPRRRPMQMSLGRQDVELLAYQTAVLSRLVGLSMRFIAETSACGFQSAIRA
ncbi:hypothetical protein EGW08_011468 [Elysia chlorotica]|uniref:CCHC-type domain-containing protein n=1 Tax=Elysia chlorotica TaxID=188477 RepID=A0A433TGQ2_ELYCH|nr:hypothetical protein EGW08_011468 [Elysia chlorotica]